MPFLSLTRLLANSGFFNDWRYQATISAILDPYFSDDEACNSPRLMLPKFLLDSLGKSNNPEEMAESLSELLNIHVSHDLRELPKNLFKAIESLTESDRSKLMKTIVMSLRQSRFSADNFCRLAHSFHER